MAAFQSFAKSGDASKITGFSLDELREANYQLGDRDKKTGWRIALTDKIAELEKADEKSEERKHQSKIRAWQLIVGILIALLIAGLSKILFGT
jgi:hypothetical protein